jgi:hypothetical protein
MATLADIDTQAAVRKFLDRTVISDKEDPQADSSDEIQAVLEACALTFLLTPQAALSFTFTAKNVLSQVVTAELQMLDYLYKTTNDVNNPNELISDTSDLVEAQVALVEVDRIGRVSDDVKAYSRYQSAVNRFLDRQLARTLKRKRSKEFERSGTEARQDLLRVLSAFSQVHPVMIDRLNKVALSVDDFSSVDLTAILATQTVARVRESLKKVLSGFNLRTLSKTSAAVELLAGSSALKSISKLKDIYDPLVDTGSFPSGRTIQVSSEEVAAQSVHATIDFTGISAPWTFGIASDWGDEVTGCIPATGVSEKPFLLTKSMVSGLTLPADQLTLYLRLDGVTPPPGEVYYVQTVTFPAGVNTLVDLQGVLDAALPASLGCVVLGTRLVIYGKGTATKVTVLETVPGTFASPSGEYTPAATSAHELFGLAGGQVSETSQPSAETLAILIGEQISSVTASVEDGLVVVKSKSTAITSALVFFGVLGPFDDAVAEPSYLTLMENGEVLDPAGLDVSLGSLVQVADTRDLDRSLCAEVSRIADYRLYFDVASLPRCHLSSVTVTSPLVVAVQSLLEILADHLGVFAGDVALLQRVLAPLYYSPTQAQIGDAKRGLQTVRDKVYALSLALGQVSLRPDRNDYSGISNQILFSLEERGLDRALDLLKQASFSEFFSLTKEKAAKSSRFMLSMEEVCRNDFSRTTVEADIPEQRPKGSTLDEDILAGDNLVLDERETT